MREDDLGIQEQADDDLPTSAPIAVAEIAGKKFVAGLFWQPLTKPRAYKKEAREIGKREGMDIVTIRRSTIMQAGFAPKGQGAIKGMYSLAAALAGKLGNSWIGVFALDRDRYVFVAVDEGAIVPGCDVIGDRDDIEKRLRFYYNSNSEWGAVYVPPDFDFGGEEADIQALLADGNFETKEWREFRLQPLSFGLTSRELITYGAIVGLVVVAGLGGLRYKEHLERKEREARIRAELIRKAEMERIKANTKKEKAVKTFEHPWIKLPSVDDFLKGCGGAIEALPLSVGGWIIDTASCDVANVAVQYKRTGTATAAGFLAEAKVVADTPPTFGDGYETARFVKPVKILLGGDDALVAADEMLTATNSVFQGLGVKVMFVEKPFVVPKPAVLPGQAAPAEQEPPPAPDWKTYTFSFDSDFSPQVLFAGHAWTGMRISKLEMKLTPETAKLNWIVAGELYAK